MQATVGQDQTLEAFDTYFLHDVVMAEATGGACKGKETILRFLEEWLSGIREMGVGAIAVVTSY